MKILAGNLYHTTLSDLIAAGKTHLEIRCTCPRGAVWMPLRLLSLPCGASVEKLREHLICRCGRRPTAVDGIDATEFVPNPGVSWDNATGSRKTEGKWSTVGAEPNPAVVPDTSPPTATPISLVHDPK